MRPERAAARMQWVRAGKRPASLLLLALLLATVARGATAEAIVSLPSTGPTITKRGQEVVIPVSISNFVNPTEMGAHWLGVNILPSQGLTIQHLLIIGPWTISGNPNGYYGWHNYYVDGWHMTASFINNNETQVPGCITQHFGVAFSVRVVANQNWNGGRETLTLGQSGKESEQMPTLRDCALTSLPIRYGNTVCVLDGPQPVTGDPGGTCHSVNCETAATSTVKTTWARLKAIYR